MNQADYYHERLKFHAKQMGTAITQTVIKLAQADTAKEYPNKKEKDGKNT